MNLGQGKPDWEPPADIVAQLVAASETGGFNQYAPGPGILPLRQAIANHQQRFYDLTIDPTDGVIVTAGATEAILATVLGLINPGDEVIIIEPAYDCYVPAIIMAQATPVYVPLQAPDWTLDLAQLQAAFTSRTRAIILNTPHNPTGHVCSYAELIAIAQLCQQHDCIVIADEVYEHLVYDDAKHIPMATIAGMFDRTITISSAGKTFSATGWKIGWASGPADLMEGVARAHQFITFAVHHPSQVAIAYALNLPDTYYTEYQQMYQHKRQLLLTALDRGGFSYSIPLGAYFVLGNYAHHFSGPSAEFAPWLIEHAGVAAIPLETLYAPNHSELAGTHIRFAFCKADDLLLQVGDRLASLR